ncbi:hypothetical protein DYB31_012138 [Aphanomyces astaci]|uniref:Uncharacterized protein n=1 Tax=Aphanomyces astaci TaxID=112090 RepID=A0A397F548_APHAT|nr:hypothetical protein DYB31_012138 [Aphanomyces astaci]
MDKWAAIAETLAANEDFGRPDFDAKKANNRFIALAEAHRKSNRVSARVFGISEDVGEKLALLCDILSAHDDAKEEDVMTMMQEQVQSELEFQREKHENEIKERQKDRELLAQQIWNQQESMRIQQESMAALIKLLMNKQ